MNAERSPRTLFVVRRSHDERFRLLQETFAAEPAEIIWDRRDAERRQHRYPVSAERRRRDRRGPVPASWTALDFVVAPPRDPTKPG